MKIITKNEESTINLGKMIGRALVPGDVINLNGDLGAGKTYLTKGIAKGLEVEDYVTSPTFIIVNEYQGRVPLYHFDVYRINDIYEMYEIGFEEYLYGEGICIVEWGNMVSEMLPKGAINITINRIDENTREISITDEKRFEFLKEAVLWEYLQ